MKLAEVSDVQALIRFKVIEEIDTAIDQALESATSALETKLRTPVNRHVGYDIFRLKPVVTDPSIFEYHLRLSRGFVDEEATFTVRTAGSIAALTGDSAVNITADCIVNKEQGILSYVGGALNGLFCRVDYTAGFLDNGETYEDVPDWLNKAACFHAIVSIDAISPKLRGDESNETPTAGLRRIYGEIIGKHIRYYPKHALPLVKS